VSLPDLSLAAVFVRVVELEGFTAAAKALAVQKSSVSRSIAQLEETLGVRLLQRTSRKVSLTDEGRAFYERVREPVAGVLDAMTDVADREGEPRGAIRFTAPSDLGAQILGEPVASFVRKYPQIHVDLVLTNRLVDLVAERIDLALRATPRLEDSSLVARRINGPHVGLYASRDYVKRRGKPTTVAELATHDCVLFRGHEGRVTWKLQGPSGPESITVRGPINADDFGFVRRAMSEGVGIGMLPITGPADDLVRVLPDFTVEAGSMYLVLPSGRQIPRRVALFRDHLLERLQRC
jgi:DNA-binding transcriptional LysR family regulator